MNWRSWLVHLTLIVVCGGLGAAGLALGLWLHRIELAQPDEDD